MDFTDRLRLISLAAGEFYCNAKRCLALLALPIKLVCILHLSFAILWFE
jgi:hypothetical protein